MIEQTQNLIYLAGCAVHQSAPDPERVAAADLDALWSFANRHKMAATVAGAFALLEDPAAVLGQEEWDRWRTAGERSLRRTLLFQAEREEIFDWMDGQGIWYLPLKGILIQELYPQLGMREMADNDILFDGSRREQVQQFMLQRGYSLDEGVNHDEYTKEPFYNFELHRRLFHPVHAALHDYYADIGRLMRRDPDRPFGYTLSQTDMYVYVVAHAYKHYTQGGTGLRTLLDDYLMCRGWELDRDRARQELETIGVLDFSETMKRLSQALFADPDGVRLDALSAEERDMLAAMAGAGMYGTVDGQVKNNAARMGIDGEWDSGGKKAKYMFRRLFPGKERLRRLYPVLEKHPALLPAVAVYRAVVEPVKNAKRVASELRALKRIK